MTRRSDSNVTNLPTQTNTIKIVRPPIKTDHRRITDLITMLSYRRPYKSMTEQQFIRQWIAPLGAVPDGLGNYILRIGDSPILWSAHTDTVHHHEGFQKIVVSAKMVAKVDDSSFMSSCLGADDATGCWIMREMILAKKEGLYIFHRGEERGGIGSTWIAKNKPEILKDIKAAVAFDRKGYGDVINYQGGNCASDKFTGTFSEMLGDWWKPCSGIYTDTAEYKSIIPECTNLSVGYYNQHCGDEWQDLTFASWLRDKMIEMDVDKLLESVSRDPKKSYHYASGQYSGYNSHYDQDYWDPKKWGQDEEETDEERIKDMVRNYPTTVTKMLMAFGITPDDLAEMIYETSGVLPWNYKSKY